MIVFDTFYLILFLILAITSCRTSSSINRIEIDSYLKGLCDVPEIDRYILKKAIERLSARAADTALSVASKNGNSNTFKLILDSRPDINIHDFDAGLGLIQASENGFLSIVELLLEKMIDIPASDAGQSLINASQNGHLSIIELLLKKRSDISTLNASQALVQASQNVHFSIVEHLLKERGDISTYFKSQGLFYASLNDDYEIVELLLHNLKEISITAFKAVQLLQRANQHGKFEIVELVLEKTKHIASQTFYEASTNNYFELVQVILQYRCDYISAETCGHRLLEASKRGHFDLVRLILENRCDSVSADCAGQSLLVATINSHPEVVEVILRHKSDSISADYAIKSLLEASTSSNSEIAEKIILYKFGAITVGASSNQIICEVYENSNDMGLVKLILLSSKIGIKSVDFISQNLLDASRRGLFEVVQLILQYRSDLISPESAGQSLVEASKHGNLLVVEHLLLCEQLYFDTFYVEKGLLEASNNDHLEIVNVILDNRFLEINNPASITRSFISASKTGRLDIIKKISNLADNKVATEFAGEGLWRASENGHYDIVNFILERYKDGFDISFACQGIADALKNSHLDIVRLFLELENDIVDIRAAGQILLKASEHGHTETINFLLKIDDSIIYTGTDYDYFDIVKTLYERGNISINATVAGYGLRFASEHGQTEIVMIFLEKRIDIDAAFLQSGLLVALENGHMDIVKLMFEYRSADISGLVASQCILEASKRGHLEVVRLLLGRVKNFNFRCQRVCELFSNLVESLIIFNAFRVQAQVQRYRPSAGSFIGVSIVRQALVEALENGHFDVVKLFLLLEVRKSGIDGEFIGKCFIEASERNKADVMKFLIETRKDIIDVSLMRQGLANALRNRRQDIVELLVGCKRVGLVNNNVSCPCCRIISLVSCLFNINRFREVLYSSDFKNNFTALKLAKLLVQMQLGNTNINMEHSFVQFFREKFIIYRKFWSSILQLRNKILDILPEETKNVFQVSLRIFDSKNPTLFKDVTRNFIIISKNYESISKAIASCFSFDANNNLEDIAEGSEERTTSFNQVKILNRPDIIFFCINRSNPNVIMKLNRRLKISSFNSNRTQQHTYVLQAFCYSDTEFRHHMSFIRDFSQFSKVSEWYRYNDHTVSPTFTKDHLNSMRKYAREKATFAFYVRSDLVHMPSPDIPEKLLPTNELEDIA